MISLQGTIVDCDPDLAFLHGYHGAGDLIGVNIKMLIPALVLPTGENMNKVRGTYVTLQGV